MNALLVDRALNIYCAIADRPGPRDVRSRLSQHLQQIYSNGETDEHKLTVHGLSYLQSVDRERDSRV